MSFLAPTDVFLVNGKGLAAWRGVGEKGREVRHSTYTRAMHGWVTKIQFLGRMIKSPICNERTCFHSSKTRLYGELWMVGRKDGRDIHSV